MIYRLKDGFVVRKIGEQIVAVPVGQQTSRLHGMIVLTESAELLWGALEKGATLVDLTELITENYEIDRETAETDVKAFLDKLQEQGALL